MTGFQTLQHARDEIRYQRTVQAANDRAADKARRAKLDRAVGHSPKCGILKCHPECTAYRAVEA
jgi:hypothetical protein